MARWWSEFNQPEPEELAYYRRAVKRYGQPALDLACGAGRILLPLLATGLDVDGVDISADMLAQAGQLAAAQGLKPTLQVQAMHELELPRRYRTIYICDSFGIGGYRAHDRLTMSRIFDHLQPGGALVFSYDLPYDGMGPASWATWLPGHRGGYPRDWPGEGTRRRLADGDELELLTRLAELDPFLQRRTLEMRLRRYHDRRVVAEEDGALHENLYFVQELLLMLDGAGFAGVSVEGRYTDRPASAEDSSLVFVARRPG